MESPEKITKPRTRTGQYAPLGVSVKDPKVLEARVKVRDYRRFLQVMEPAAWKLLAAALRDRKVTMKDRIEIAQDILTRLHGKVAGSNEADEARKKFESMSTDELKANIIDLAKEMGLDVRARTVS